MTEIIIPLTIGYNYISFPATSSDNFDTIFINSGIKSYILLFNKHNPITQQYEPVNYFEYIEEGRGYILLISPLISPPTPSQIIYDGIEYQITFDQIKLHLLNGWNLIGTGSNTIFPISWCKILDPIKENLQIYQLDPKKAYWINYDDCNPPRFNIELAISITVLSLFIYSIWKQEKRSHINQTKNI